MAKGLRRTFDVLINTANEAAVDVLLAGLDSDDPTVVEAALKALLRRRSLPGHLAILQRLDEKGEQWREILCEHRGRMSAALRNAVLGSDARLCENACQVIVWLGEFDLVPALITAAEDRRHDNADRAASTIRGLAERLAQIFSDKNALPRRDPKAVRRHVVGSLQQSVGRFDDHDRAEIIEAFLLLTPSDNPVLRSLLDDPLSSSHRPAVEILSTSDAASILNLLLNLLNDPKVPQSALTALSNRTDQRFIRPLLQKVATGRAEGVERNLGRINRVSWLSDDTTILDALDEEAQTRVMTFVMATGMPQADKLRILEYLLVCGSQPGRCSACDALEHFKEDRANRLVLKALEDPDPDVRARAVLQLRNRGIPGALGRLVGMLSAPEEVVREAARESLGEFRFDKFLGTFDMLEESARKSTGELVMRIDRSAMEGLQRELSGAARSRRLRGIAMAEAMNLVSRVEQRLHELLTDEDHFVRAEAARVLAGCNTPATREALEIALGDRSVTVREAVKASLLALDRDEPPPQQSAVSDTAEEPNS